jgi:hypothetical protein
VQSRGRYEKRNAEKEQVWRFATASEQGTVACDPDMSRAAKKGDTPVRQSHWLLSMLDGWLAVGCQMYSHAVGVRLLCWAGESARCF